jgi:hypothetical protein
VQLRLPQRPSSKESWKQMQAAGKTTPPEGGCHNHKADGEFMHLKSAATR